MKELINKQTINDLKRSQKYTLGIIIISLAVAIGMCIPLFIFVTREYRHVFAFLLTLIATIEATFILYMVVVSIVPINSYMKICNLSLSNAKYSTKGKVVSIKNKVTHFRGVAVKEIKVKDLEEENKEYVFYVEQNSGNEFAINSDYTFVTYQSVVVSYEVI